MSASNKHTDDHYTGIWYYAHLDRANSKLLPCGLCDERSHCAYTLRVKAPMPISIYKKRLLATRDGNIDKNGDGDCIFYICENCATECALDLNITIQRTWAEMLYEMNKDLGWGRISMIDGQILSQKPTPCNLCGKNRLFTIIVHLRRPIPVDIYAKLLLRFGPSFDYVEFLICKDCAEFLIAEDKKTLTSWHLQMNVAR